MAGQAQTLRCVAVVGTAYVVQGIVAAVGVALVGSLVKLGTPLEQQVALLASGAVPWVLKCAVALLLDLQPSWTLRRRAVVLAGLQTCIAAGLWVLAGAWAGFVAHGGGSLGGIPALWVAVNFAAALQDVVTDNLALDTLRGRQAWAATAMGLGHALGAGLLGSLVLGSIMMEQGLVGGLRTTAMWIAFAAVLAGTLAWMPGRPARADSAVGRPRDRIPSVEQLLALSGLLLLLVAIMLATNLTGGAAAEFLFGHLEWEVAEYLRRVPPIAAVAGLFGALAMGPLAAKLGPARASMLVGAALGLTWLWFASASATWEQPGTIISLAGCEATLQSALLVGLQALALIAAARSPWPTTAFVLAMAAINLPRALAPLMAPTLVENGWVGLFVTCGVIQLIAVAGLWPLRGWAREG